MSRFFGEIKSSATKTVASKKGQRDLVAHIRTWNMGIEIECLREGLTNVITVYKTGGSNDSQRKEVLQVLEECEN